MSIYLSIKIDISDIFAVYMILSIFLQYLQGHCFSSCIVYTTVPLMDLFAILCQENYIGPFSLNWVFVFSLQPNRDKEGSIVRFLKPTLKKPCRLGQSRGTNHIMPYLIFDGNGKCKMQN